MDKLIFINRIGVITNGMLHNTNRGSYNTLFYEKEESIMEIKRKT